VSLAEYPAQNPHSIL